MANKDFYSLQLIQNFLYMHGLIGETEETRAPNTKAPLVKLLLEILFAENDEILASLVKLLRDGTENRFPIY